MIPSLDSSLIHIYIFTVFLLSTDGKQEHFPPAYLNLWLTRMENTVALTAAPKASKSPGREEEGA